MAAERAGLTQALDLFMQIHGNVTKWNDERGFGFVEVAGTREELFVHISEFPRGERPHVGQLISFSVELKDGKKRAVGVSVPGRQSAKYNYASRNDRPAGSVLSIVIPFAIVLILGFAAYQAVTALYWQMNPADLARRDFASSASIGKAPAFKCDQRKHCSQMRSCAEAVYFLDHCPGVLMDGDNDRKPCEEQLCQ